MKVREIRGMVEELSLQSWDVYADFQDGSENKFLGTVKTNPGVNDRNKKLAVDKAITKWGFKGFAAIGWRVVVKPTDEK